MSKYQKKMKHILLLLVTLFIAIVSAIDCPDRSSVGIAHSWTVDTAPKLGPSLLRFYTSANHMSKFLNITFKENATHGGHACEKVCHLLQEPTWTGFMSRYGTNLESYRNSVTVLGMISMAFNQQMSAIHKGYLQDAFAVVEHAVALHIEIQRASSNSVASCPEIERGKRLVCPMVMDLRNHMGDLASVSGAYAQTSTFVLANALKEFDVCLENEL